MEILWSVWVEPISKDPAHNQLELREMHHCDFEMKLQELNSITDSGIDQINSRLDGASILD